MKLIFASATVITLCTCFVQSAAAASIVQVSSDELLSSFARLEKTPVYLELPDLERVQIGGGDIVSSLSTDTFSLEDRHSFASIDTRKLLELLAQKQGKTSLIPSASTLILTETATGATIPPENAGMGYIVEYDLLEEMLLSKLLNPKLKPTVIKVPATNVMPKIVLKKLDGSEQELGIVSHGISDFRGSTKARIHNIKTAMARFQGVRIDAGTTFSFNDVLGEVDGSTGYQKELVIKGDKTIPDYGGGVCQASSTMYRSALRAGFPIIERKPHSYAVSYYLPWGTDATIYPGITDLQFQNDMTTPVYIHYFMEGTNLHTLLYGTPDGRVVTLAGPNTYAFMGAPNPKVEYVSTLPPGKRVWKEYGHNGFSAWWERSITSSTGAVMTEKIISTYEPRGGFVLEGKGAEVPLQQE